MATRISGQVSKATRDALTRVAMMYRALHPDHVVDDLYSTLAKRMLDELGNECAQQGIDPSTLKKSRAGRPPKAKTTQPAPRPRTHYGPED